MSEPVISDDAPLNPVDVERHIMNVSNRIAKSVRVVSDLRRRHQDADREFKRAYATAYATAEGNQEDRKQTAILGTLDAAQARDEAYAQFTYARDLADALGKELMAWQSIGRSVTSMYSSAGQHRG
jgi:hypothetical protein